MNGLLAIGAGIAALVDLAQDLESVLQHQRQLRL